MYSKTMMYTYMFLEVLKYYYNHKKNRFKTFLLLLFTWTYIYNSTFEMNKDNQNLYETQTKNPESTQKVMLWGVTVKRCL